MILFYVELQYATLDCMALYCTLFYSPLLYSTLLSNPLNHPSRLLANPASQFAGIFRPENEWTRQAHLENNLGAKAGNYTDGSIESDLPMQQLSELFNVNHFIVSQVVNLYTFLYCFYSFFLVLHFSLSTLLFTQSLRIGVCFHCIDRLVLLYPAALTLYSAYMRIRCLLI